MHPITNADPRSPSRHLGALGAVITAIGVIASGPLLLLILPARPWRGAADFASHYVAIEALPFFGGFSLIAGFVMLVASLHTIAPPALRARTTIGMVFLSAFVALVMFNYIVQTTFVPQLVRANDPANHALLGALAMANPASLAWSIELWAYGALGIATWAVASVFDGSGIERPARWSFVANGVASVVTAVMAALIPGWATTIPGLVAYLIWNALVLVMAGLAFIVLRRDRARGSRECSPNASGARI